MSGVENVGDSVIGLVCNSKNSLRSCNFTFFNGVMAMKKSILAVSAAVAIGGMGFAGAAHAVYYFGDGENATYGGVVMGGLVGLSHTTYKADATDVVLNEGGIGNYLFTPYFTTQKDNNTLVSIVNNDAVNGKIVKVRFRGAANSEDLLDFQVFLSPSDVWTASLTQGSDGKTVITTPDKSCTLPAIGTAPAADRTFKTNRLVAVYPGALGPVLTTEDQKNAQTREGYIEYLNMADVVPGSPLFTAIKHVNGVAPCTPSMMAVLNSTALGVAGTGPFVQDANDISALGLSAASGGLTGTWSIFSNAQTKAYGDNHIAVEAVDDGGNPARGRISYAPQLAQGITDTGAPASVVNEGTADPVLRASVNSVMWNDLPDMSTPFFGTDPKASVIALSTALSKETLNNEFVATGGAGAVPWDTDWVVSHATRRYYATLTSGGSIAQGDKDFYDTTAPNGNLAARSTAGGYMLCQAGTLTGFDREEGTAGVAFSPSSQTPFCGEVNVLSFNRASQALNASVTNQVGTLTVDGQPIQAGWAKLALRKNGRSDALGAPVVGYSATSAVNTSTYGNFGYNNRHRWTRAPQSPEAR